MQVQLSSEQTQLQDGVRRLLDDCYRFEHRQKTARNAPGWCPRAWRQYADMGLHAIVVPCEWGGLDGGAAELLPVLQEMAKAATLEPYISSSVLGASALAAGSPSLKNRLLGQVAMGEHLLAFAHEELPLENAQVRAERVDGAWTLTGCKLSVLQARDAQSIIVSARVRPEDDGIGLFLVAVDAPRMRRHDYTLVDQRTASDIHFAGTPATEVAPASSEATAALRRTLALGTAALVAEAAGAARAALEATTSYLATRKQFGRPLSEFQALRHRSADMLVSVETIEAMAYLAAISVDDAESASAAARDLAAAKLLAGRHGRWVCEQAIQLHGAIGMTDEYIVGHYLQRLAVIDALLGNEDVQLDQLTTSLIRPEEAPCG